MPPHPPILSLKASSAPRPGPEATAEEASPAELGRPQSPDKLQVSSEGTQIWGSQRPESIRSSLSPAKGSAHLELPRGQRLVSLSPLWWGGIEGLAPDRLPLGTTAGGSSTSPLLLRVAPVARVQGRPRVRGSFLQDSAWPSSPGCPEQECHSHISSANPHQASTLYPI